MTTKYDTRTLTDTGKQISKAFEGGDPSSTLLTLLSPLEKWTPTEDLLRASRIGVVVAKVRASKDPKVAGLASQLVNKWKAAVKKKPAAHTVGGGGSPAAAAPARNGATNDTGSPAPDTQPKKETPPPRYSLVAPEKRNAKEDKVNTAVTGNTTRDGCITLIYNGLCFHSEQPPTSILNVSTTIEQAAYDTYWHTDSAQSQYKAKVRSLHLNLKNKNSAPLRRDVFYGVIQPQRFVTMTAEEMKSEDRKKEDEALQKKNMNNSMAPQEEKSISKTMTCGKCKGNRVAYSQAQTRSADEPMTTFCECQICMHTWKFS